MARLFSSNLRGKVRNFSLPKNRPLVSLYEQVMVLWIRDRTTESRKRENARNIKEK